MGLMSLIFGRAEEKSTANLEDHKINKSRVISPTNDLVPSPKNPGNFSSIRSVPVVENPRYFDKKEASLLKKLAKAKQRDAGYTEVAYEALQQIDNADVKVHIAHTKYQGYLAENEVKKLTANTSYATKLHGMRSRYSSLDLKLDQADQKAVSRIQEIKAKIQSQLK